MSNKFSKTPPASADEFVGQAAVAATQTEPPVTIEAGPPVDPASAPARVPQAKPRPAVIELDEGVYRTLTLRLTKARYKALKMRSTVTETPIQQMLVEALDAYLAKQPR